MKQACTEEKIRAAAFKIFQQKGFAGTRTRDIANEAGINPALLNYYYRSKEKLFEIVMKESLGRVFTRLQIVLNESSSSIPEKIDTIVNIYIDLLKENPNIPLFVLSEIQANPEKFKKQIGFSDIRIQEMAALKQAKEFMKNAGLDNIDPFHIVINMISMSIFPFAAKPMIKTLTGKDEQAFEEFIEERRKLIPVWIKSMLGIICFVFFLFTGNIYAQNFLTIDGCQLKARENYPQIKQFGLIEQMKEYKLSNLSKAYLPQLILNGQAAYQSDVVTVPVNIPGVDIPAPDKDQYKATIDLTQTIWDGGSTSSRKKITKASNEVDKQSIEVDLYKIRTQVNQLFFGILTLDEQLIQLDIPDKDLKNSYDVTNAMLQNGTATSSDVDAIHVELLNNEQKRVEIRSLRKACMEMLSALINEKLSGQTTLVKPPEILINPFSAMLRPEINLFGKQRKLFEVQESLITAQNRPKFSLFAQGGYGKPGLNMLSDNFIFFATGGIRLTWNFGNLYTGNNEKKLINIDKNLVNTREEIFIFNTNLQLTQIYNEVLKAKELMEKDDEIITLRNRVKIASESKYENGVYTVNDLIRDIHAESQSRQAKILHEIQYLMNSYNYRTVQGTIEH
ncbi:MAG: TolC family protein [Dysgonamonadaceae bacterium]|jgi:AcrR family transcriptional regulator/outer membrane protein TolC|nr:TolC family protein [Dysgonamonadaceae bacterium]